MPCHQPHLSEFAHWLKDALGFSTTHIASTANGWYLRAGKPTTLHLTIDETNDTLTIEAPQPALSLITHYLQGEDKPLTPFALQLARTIKHLIAERDPTAQIHAHPSSQNSITLFYDDQPVCTLQFDDGILTPKESLSDSWAETISHLINTTFHQQKLHQSTLALCETRLAPPYTDQTTLEDILAEVRCSPFLNERLRNQIKEFLKKDGVLANYFASQGKSFSPRPSQIEMALNVLDNLLQREPHHLLIEAPTGTGKTFAYLVPVLLLARQLHLMQKARYPDHKPHHTYRAIVATHTKALQDQLLNKDLKELNECFATGNPPFPFKYEMALGRNNYLCIRKTHEWLATLPTQPHHEQLREKVKQIIENPQTHTGTFAQLEEILTDQEKEILFTAKDDIQSEHSTTLEKRCPFYNSCFYYRARSRWRHPQNTIVVFNHSILLHYLELAPDHLPPFQALIIDEAHSLPAAAENLFANEISADGLTRTATKALHRLHTLQNYMYGETPQPLHSLAQLLSTLKEIDRASPTSLRNLLEAAQEHLSSFKKKLRHITNQFVAQPAINTLLEEKGAVEIAFTPPPTESPEKDVFPYAHSFTCQVYQSWTTFIQEALQPIFQHLTHLLEEAEGEILEEDDLLSIKELVIERTCNPVAQEVKAKLEILSSFLKPPSSEKSEVARWLSITQGKRKTPIHWHEHPVDISPFLGELLETLRAEKHIPIIYTSATLCALGSFSFIRERLGLKDNPQVTEKRLPAVFNYEKQMKLLVGDLEPPPPRKANHQQTQGKDNYHQQLTRYLLELAQAAKGRTLVLFTSYEALKECEKALSQPLRQLGCTLIIADRHTSKAHALQTYRKSPHTHILAGTDTFWQGIDLPGESLLLVIITRLPFDVPNTALARARKAHFQSTGRNYFEEFSLPSASMILRQGVGRLIRTEKDYGIVIVLDGRLLSRRYGKYLQRDLPIKPRPATLQKMKDEINILFNGLNR